MPGQACRTGLAYPGRYERKGGQIVKSVIVALVVGALAITVTGSSAIAKPTKRTGGADICVLLPDPKTSVRQRAPLP